MYERVGPLLVSWTYYRLKPLIPWKVRIGVRRWAARRRRTTCGDHWPIYEAAGERPGNFPGWPEEKRFAFVLTHDVESKTGVERCRQLVEMDAAHGFRASFNFIPEGGYQTPQELREWLKAKGLEVGVHDLRHDGKLYDSRPLFRQHAARINQYLRQWRAVGFRSAFMHRNLDWLHDLKITYDMSTFDTDPFEPQPEGVHTIFPFWCASGDGKSGYVELPYTLPQDSTLFMVLEEKGIDIWRQKLDWIAQRGGMALLNVHPDYICFDGNPRPNEYPAALYTELLDYVSTAYRDQYWHALPQEVAEHTRRCAMAA
ncbi:MAG TPA: hypothetical protein VJ063_06245 [Verrucomicrobiae bacterium]|nr:hypothetical protein [Verrucomicrobiae bacterium]